MLQKTILYPIFEVGRLDQVFSNYYNLQSYGKKKKKKKKGN